MTRFVYIGWMGDGLSIFIIGLRYLPTSSDDKWNFWIKEHDTKFSRREWNSSAIPHPETIKQHWANRQLFSREHRTGVLTDTHGWSSTSVALLRTCGYSSSINTIRSFDTTQLQRISSTCDISTATNSVCFYVPHSLQWKAHIAIGGVSWRCSLVTFVNCGWS